MYYKADQKLGHKLTLAFQIILIILSAFEYMDNWFKRT